MAVLTRPALALPAALLAVMAWRPGQPRRRQSAMVYAAALLPFVVAQALLHIYLFGNVFASGYGAAGWLFTLDRVPRNVWNYAKWLTYSLTPLFYVALAVGFIKARDRTVKRLAALIFIGVTVPYLFYFTFDDWETTRFLLPGLAFLLIMCAFGVNASLMSVIGSRWAALGALAVATALAVVSYLFVQRHGAFTLAELESRYPRLGEWIAQTTPANAAVLAMQHSGSIRFYGHRVTLRWDAVPPGRLHDLVAALAARGRPVYLALDGPAEEKLFHERFDDCELARLALAPAGRVSGINLVEVDARE